MDCPRALRTGTQGNCAGLRGGTGRGEASLGRQDGQSLAFVADKFCFIYGLPSLARIAGPVQLGFKNSSVRGCGIWNRLPAGPGYGAQPAEARAVFLLKEWY